jgi:hypothetical protein
LIQEWQRVRTDWLTVRPAAEPVQSEGEPSAVFRMASVKP